MVVVDPRRTETAKAAARAPLRASRHRRVRAARDAARAVRRGPHHSPVVRRRAGRRARPRSQPFTPERAEAASAASPRTSYDGWRGSSRRAESAAVYGRVGVSTQEFGLVATWAVQLLNLVTGNLDRPGGVMLTRPAVDAVGRGLVGRGHHDRWRSRVRGLPEFAGELPVATLADEILHPRRGPGPRRCSRWPATRSPRPRRQRGSAEAIAGLDFVAAVDIYVNETTRHADVILPPTSALERDHYDLVFHALAVRNTARFTPAPVRRSPRARCTTGRSTARSCCAPQRLLTREAAAEGAARPAGADAGLPDPDHRPAAADRHGPAVGAPAARAARSTSGRSSPACPERLMTQDHRIDAAPRQVLDDLARLDAVPFARRRAAAVGRRHQRDNNSWMHNAPRLTKGRPRHQLSCTPTTSPRAGIADGAVVRGRLARSAASRSRCRPATT